jgi:hypothetical protein
MPDWNARKHSARFPGLLRRTNSSNGRTTCSQPKPETSDRLDSERGKCGRRPARFSLKGEVPWVGFAGASAAPGGTKHLQRCSRRCGYVVGDMGALASIENPSPAWRMGRRAVGIIGHVKSHLARNHRNESRTRVTVPAVLAAGLKLGCLHRYVRRGSPWTATGQSGGRDTASAC